MNWDESTTGKGGRERRELCPKLETPWESVKEKKKKARGWEVPDPAGLVQAR